tara:strand:- start:293 stop:640 length:348 start_codon:yes stop_codon:yes gene_type:complete
MAGLLVAYNLAYADYRSNNVRNIARRRNDDFNRLSPKVLKNNRLKNVSRERELTSENHKRTRNSSKVEQNKIYRRITQRAEQSVKQVISKTSDVTSTRVTPNLDPVRGTNIDIVG